MWHITHKLSKMTIFDHIRVYFFVLTYVLTTQKSIFTARIRRIREGTVFSLSIHTSMGGGGRYPHPADRVGLPPPSPTEGYPHPSWPGGNPSFPMERYVIQSWTEGMPILLTGRYPHQVDGHIPGYPVQDRMGVPSIEIWDRVTPCPDLGMGIPPSRPAKGYLHPDLGRRYPPSRPGMGITPIQTWEGVPPAVHVRFQDGGIPNQNLLCGRRYASCVHAGGLSC